MNLKQFYPILLGSFLTWLQLTSIVSPLAAQDPNMTCRVDSGSWRCGGSSSPVTNIPFDRSRHDGGPFYSTEDYVRMDQQRRRQALRNLYQNMDDQYFRYCSVEFGCTYLRQNGKKRLIESHADTYRKELESYTRRLDESVDNLAKDFELVKKGQKPQHSDVAKTAVARLPAARVGSIKVERDNLRKETTEYLRKASKLNAQAEEQRRKQQELEQDNTRKIDYFRSKAQEKIARRSYLDANAPPMSLEDLARLQDEFAPKPIPGASRSRDEIEPSLDPNSEDGKAFLQALHRSQTLQSVVYGDQSQQTGKRTEQMLQTANELFADSEPQNQHLAYRLMDSARAELAFHTRLGLAEFTSLSLNEQASSLIGVPLQSSSYGEYEVIKAANDLAPKVNDRAEFDGVTLAAVFALGQMYESANTPISKHFLSSRFLAWSVSDWAAYGRGLPQGVRNLAVGLVDSGKLLWDLGAEFVDDPATWIGQAATTADYLVTHYDEVLGEIFVGLWQYRNHLRTANPEERGIIEAEIIAGLIPFNLPILKYAAQTTKEIGEASLRLVRTKGITILDKLEWGMQHVDPLAPQFTVMASKESDALLLKGRLYQIAEDGGSDLIKATDDVIAVTKDPAVAVNAMESAKNTGFKKGDDVAQLAKGWKSVSDEVGKKILYGATRAEKPRELIGVHSPKVLSDSRFNVTDVVTNSDGTKTVRLTKDLGNGIVSKRKKTTLFPDSWSNEKIINVTKYTSQNQPLARRSRDGATLHRSKIDGVEIDVIKDGEEVTSAFPTGGTGHILDGFEQL